MPSPAPHNISIADLAAAGIRLRPVEAVSIARDLTLRAHRGELPGIPMAAVLRFTSDGEVVCEGPVSAEQSVERAGRLLESLLPGFDAPPEFRVPGALRLVVARALGTLDLPAYRTLDGFAAALVRFSAMDPATVVRGLVLAWRSAVESAGPDTVAVLAGALEDEQAEELELTVSDVRRARRSTGLTLTDIAERSRIPISLLRELEWGYFVNWPSGQYGRSQLVRYARAAGLDVEVVTGALWPALEATARAREVQPAIVEDADGREAVAADRIVDGDVVDETVRPLAIAAVAGEMRLVKVEGGLPQPRQEHKRRSMWLAALAIPALLAVAALPAAWNSTDDLPSETAAPSAAAKRTAARPASSDAVAATSGQSTTAAAPAQSAQVLDQAPQVAAPAAPAPQSAPAVKPVSAPDGPDRADLRGDAVFSPAFSSVGTAMFYHADEGDRSAIMRADTDTTGAVLRVTSIVDDEASNFHARPSPDGTRIAFDSDRDGERAVYVADADGRKVRRISGPGFAAVPSWSPDGGTLAFVRAEPKRPRVWNLWTVDLETGETRRLTSHKVGQPWGAAWFPDGRRIAYSHEERLIVRSLADGRERVYKSPKPGHLVRTPAVSPDGRQVMFQVHRDGAWLLDVENGGMRRVLADPTAEEFTWSPDGRRVAYHSRKAGGWGVWMMGAR